MNYSHEDPWKVVSNHLNVAPERIAIRTTRKEITFSELKHAVQALSTRFSSSLRPHMAVGLLLGMLPEYLIADLTILRSNLVKIPLNPMLSAAEMAHILKHSETKILLTSSKLTETDTDKVEEISRLLPEMTIVEVSFEELVQDTAQPVPPVTSDPDDLAAIYYTGGTTGQPKGVMHSRGGVASTIVAHALEAEIGSADVLLLSTSLSHSAGSFAHAAISQGSTLVLLDRFTPAEFCKTAKTNGVNWAMMVPTMLYRLLDYLVKYPENTPLLDTLVYGSAPITPSRLREAIERLGPVLIQLFGQTECPNWGTSLSKRDHALALEQPELLLSCGTPCTLASVRVVDDSGIDVPPGESGEILLSAPYAMVGYWQNKEATAATLVDGWVNTRDIGQWDERGYLYVRDRKTDMIITGGYNVYSSEVEAELQLIEGISQVAVIGIPDSEWGESVCAVIVPSEGSKITEDSILVESRKVLGAYKRPKQVIFVDEIPLTPFGKADKKRLRAPFWENTSRVI